MQHYCPTCRQHLSRFGHQCGCGHVWNESRFNEFGFNTTGLGFDITDGDPVENLGDGLGIDLRTGQLEEDFGGIDVPFGDPFGW